MTDTYLVTGGSGRLGSAVTARLRAAGQHARVLSRRPRPPDLPADIGWVTGDLTTGAGLSRAVDGVSSILHCATNVWAPRHDAAGTERLIAVAQTAGSPNLLYISIVGVDSVPLPYYRAKLAAEQRVRAGGLPWTILRATQFHDLVDTILRTAARLPAVMVVPAAVPFQPVAVGDVADRLVQLAGAEPTGQIQDFGGPEILPVADLARAYLRAANRRRVIVPIRVPGKIFAGYRRGGHLTPEHADGRVTFEEFLAERYGHRSRTE